MEALPEGGRRIVMSRDFEEVPVDGEDAGTTWMGQQVCFVLDDGREDTVEDITTTRHSCLEQLYLSGIYPKASGR